LIDMQRYLQSAVPVQNPHATGFGLDTGGIPVDSSNLVTIQL
jgi:hypothetical protein